MTIRKTLAQLIAGNEYRVVRADIPTEILKVTRTRQSVATRKATTPAAIQGNPVAGHNYDYLKGKS